MADNREQTPELERIGADWIDRIQKAEKREEKWRKAAEKAEATYSAGAYEHAFADSSEFNILFSNTETIVPAIYNSMPIPDIRPRHSNPDPAAKEYSDALERAISTLIDDDALDTEIELMAYGAVLPGRGLIRLKVDFDEQGEDAAASGEGSLMNKRIVFENVAWDDYREGPASRPSEVPWKAYRHHVSTEEIERLTDEDKRAPRDGNPVEEDNTDGALWEIWCRESGQVYLVAEQNSRVVSIKDDPLNLSTFYPSPDAVVPLRLGGKQMPICPYQTYEDLAEELNTATRRINAIMQGLKVRGVLAADAGLMDALSQAGDWQLTPAPDAQSLVATGGLQNAVMWWPVDVAIAVLAQLYQEREATKVAIYEVTGISDIVRGSSVASETARAQQIKTQWGSLRLKRVQRQVATHIRGLFVASAEILSSTFSVAELELLAGVELSPSAADLHNGLNHYRIDVETNSTVRGNMEMQRQEMGDFLTASAQYFSTMAPIIQGEPAATGAVMQLFHSFARTFNLGKSAEDAIEQIAISAAKKAEEGPTQEEQAEQQQAKQAQRALLQAEVQGAILDVQGRQLDMQVKQAEQQRKGAETQQQASLQQAALQQKAMADQIKAAHEAKKLRLEEAKMQASLALEAQKMGLQVDDQRLRELQQEIDSLLRIEELDLERVQERPVAI